MPGGDRTGPMGMGPMSGRGAGLCAGFERGFGRGRGGGGRGCRNMYFATGQPGWMRGAPTPDLAALKQQAEYFGKALEDIRGRIQELEAKPADK